MELSDLLLFGLAANQIVELWRHSPLFETYYEAAKARGWTVLECGWCLSVWVAFGLMVIRTLVTAIIGLQTYWCAWPAIACAGITYLVICALAISRLANLLNDFSKPWNRTPGRVTERIDDGGTGTSDV